MRSLRLAVLSVLPLGLLALPTVTPPVPVPKPVPPVTRTLPVPLTAAAATPAGLAAARTAGAPVAEIPPTPTAPFRMVGLSWLPDPGGGALTAQVRVRTGGTWTGWETLAVSDTTAQAGGPDTRPGERTTTDPLWVGRADAVEARVLAPGAVPRDLPVLLIDPGTSPADANPGAAGRPLGGAGATAAAGTGQPNIITRAQWGADESLRLNQCPDGPTYMNTIKVAFVHATVNTNTYGPGDSAAIVRGIYAYHVQGNGWCDIGYNFLVDRYGQIFEGRYGGIDQAVLGAQTGGFNVDSFGVAMIGTFTTETPPPAVVSATAQIVGWKLGRYGRDPLGTEVLTAGTFAGSRYPAGTQVTLPTVAGHRDANYTDDPGNQGYAALDTIRRQAKPVADATPRGPWTKPPAGGWVLDSDGRLVAFGRAPAQSVTGVPAGSAQAVAVAPGQAAGYVLDGSGVLHPFGGAPAPTDGPRWGFSAARDVVLQPDGRSGYVLDVCGGVWGFGGRAGLPISRYDCGVTARRLVLRADGQSGYVLFADGGVAAFGGAPAVARPALPGGRAAVDLILRPDQRSLLVVDDAGQLWPTGGGGAVAAPPPAATVAGAGRPDGASGYLLAPGGLTTPFGDAGAVLPVKVARAVDLGLYAEPQGYTLDYAGALHPFGGAPPARTSAYWPGWDIARWVVMGPKGNGWVMDAWAGMHPFGTDAVPPPTGATGLPYWPGWQIARGVVLLPGRDNAGYVLDGWGGLHPFGGAPAVRASGYWTGWDIARGLALRPDGTGGYVIDGWGGLHPFAVGSNPMPAEPSGVAYFPGQDVVRKIVLTGPTSGYTLDAGGAAYPFGGASAEGLPTRAGGLGGAGTDPRGWLVEADAGGWLYTVGTGAPGLAPSAVWNGNVVRDVAVRN